MEGKINRLRLDKELIDKYMIPENMSLIDKKRRIDYLIKDLQNIDDYDIKN